MKRSTLGLALMALIGTGLYQAARLLKTQSYWITGQVTRVASDGSYLILDDKKIEFPRDFLDPIALSEGDLLKVKVRSQGDRFKGIDYRFQSSKQNTVLEELELEHE